MTREIIVEKTSSGRVGKVKTRLTQGKNAAVYNIIVVGDGQDFKMGNLWITKLTSGYRTVIGFDVGYTSSTFRVGTFSTFREALQAGRSRAKMRGLAVLRKVGK